MKVQLVRIRRKGRREGKEGREEERKEEGNTALKTATYESPSPQWQRERESDCGEGGSQGSELRRKREQRRKEI